MNAAPVVYARLEGEVGLLQRVQARTLNIMFRRAAINMGEYLEATETDLRLALKAQAQSRATVEALAEMKNPRAVAFVRQANIARQQQVNNGAPVAHGHVGEGPQPANELLKTRPMNSSNGWSP